MTSTGAHTERNFAGDFFVLYGSDGLEACLDYLEPPALVWDIKSFEIRGPDSQAAREDGKRGLGGSDGYPTWVVRNRTFVLDLNSQLAFGTHPTRSIEFRHRIDFI